MELNPPEFSSMKKKMWLFSLSMSVVANCFFAAYFFLFFPNITPSLHEPLINKRDTPSHCRVTEKTTLTTTPPEVKAPGPQGSGDELLLEREVALGELREDLGISEEMVKQKELILSEVAQESRPVFEKYSPGMPLSLADRRELLAIEERGELRLEKVFGKRRWHQYREKMNRHNRQLLRGGDLDSRGELLFN